MTEIPSARHHVQSDMGSPRWGGIWLIFAALAMVAFFWTGIAELIEVWQLPEYSHGPLIPILSALLFLRHLKSVPARDGPPNRVWPGVILLVVSLAFGAVGRLIDIDDIVAYGLILWVGAIILICFGWDTGKQFWPSVLHLVFMLPLPGALYYAVSTYLQGISSELGVFFVRLLDISVFLDGNIINLGVYKLHVAEACSGLRYLFPILSFSYIFAALYQGPFWHKAVLLLAAAPITIFMNALRIAIAAVVVNEYGVAHVEGFAHFFEGWVIFMSCVLLLFVLAVILVRLHPQRRRLVDVLDLETNGLWTQVRRAKFLHPSAALIGAGLLTAVGALFSESLPARPTVIADRYQFVVFPKELEDWRRGPHSSLDPETEAVLAADDYLSVRLERAEHSVPVELFIAWYENQNRGGVHSPEVCLPGGGWEIANLNSIVAPIDTGDSAASFTLNRAIIQKGMERMLVYYWYDQQGLRTASVLDAKFRLLQSKIRHGRNDSAIVRLLTPIQSGEDVAAAEARLKDSLGAVLKTLPRFIPGHGPTAGHVSESRS